MSLFWVSYIENTYLIYDCRNAITVHLWDENYTNEAPRTVVNATTYVNNNLFLAKNTKFKTILTNEFWDKVDENSHAKIHRWVKPIVLLKHGLNYTFSQHLHENKLKQWGLNFMRKHFHIDTVGMTSK